MSMRAGLELSSDRIRAITTRGWRLTPVDTFEIKWNPDLPRDAVSLLMEHLGRVDEIAIAIGLGFTHVKEVALPRVPDEARRAMLTLEPDRFFPVEPGEIVAATRRDSDLVFAAEGRVVDAWVAALEVWAPIASIEPAPVSLARALRHARSASGFYALPSADGEMGLAEIVSGALKDVRRISDVDGSAETITPPSVGRIRTEFVTAYGALLGIDAPVGEMLVSPENATRIIRKRRNAVSRSILNVLLALAFAVGAVDRSRSRLLEREEAELTELAPRAQAAAGFQARLAQLELQTSVASAGRAGTDPVAVLAALTRRLPRDATIMSVRADGDDWQVDGTATAAGRIVPALDAEPIFENVRFLAGSARFTEGNRVYETFSVALRARR